MVRASLGKAGGDFNRRKTSVINAAYPMYGLKVKDLMAMDKWIPHQDLLASGKLHKLSEDGSDPVIFLSHQWCAFAHPDPKGEQLKALQVVLQRLKEGEVEVRTHPKMELSYNYKRIDGKATWSKFYEEGYIWHDFSCIPQPLAHKAKMEGKDIDGSGAGRPHAGMVGSDHRSGDHGEMCEIMQQLVSDLKAAVDSIPSYVERAEKLWVLVPPVAHVDVEDAVCDFNSWRSRGWCRMEYCASNLTTHDLPVMIIKNAVDPPEYFSPCDAMKTPATGGQFSYDDDRSKVLDVLQTMVTAKAKYYDEEKKDAHLARLIRCFAPMMTGGIDRQSLDTQEALHEGETAVEKLKRRLRWRDEATEAQWTKETGWNLMTIAAMTDDFEAVKELCKRDDAIELMSMVGKKIKVKHEHQKLPFAQMLIHMANGHIPLMGAMGYARPEIVTCMLEAGCPVPKGAQLLDTFCGSPCHRPTGAIFNGRKENCEAFMKVHPNAVDLMNPGGMGTFFQNFLHIACGIDRPNIKPMVEWLLNSVQDPKPLLRQRMGMGSTPTGMLAFNEDADVSALSLLVNADPEGVKADINTCLNPLPFLWFMYHTMGVLGALGHSSSASMHKMFKSFIVIGTPLHWAAMQGNVPMIGALLDLGADPTVKSKKGTKLPGCKGLTPYEILQYKFPDSAVLPAVAKMLEAKGYGECVSKAKIHQKREGLAKAKYATLKMIHVMASPRSGASEKVAAKKYQVAPAPPEAVEEVEK